MLPEQCQIALKEWAVTVRALADGQQILLLRKGGIHEGSQEFRVIHPDFLLYPTFEHQRKDLLREEYRPSLAEILVEPRQEGQLTFTHWARAAEVIEVSEQSKVDQLAPYHIWTDAYAQARLNWKPMLPLSIMLLRVFQLERPVTVPLLPEYNGCTSWVEVLTRVPLGRLVPVLPEDEFQRRVDEVKGCLGLAVAPL